MPTESAALPYDLIRVPTESAALPYDLIRVHFVGPGTEIIRRLDAHTTEPIFYI
jgi:hypothetical protein